MTHFDPPRQNQGTYRHRRRSFALRLILGPIVIAGIIAGLAYLHYGVSH